ALEAARIHQTEVGTNPNLILAEAVACRLAGVYSRWSSGGAANTGPDLWHS
ncbi:MAG: hypothetical protein F6K42_30470, partial [Leptolyngbya sp. SIO1D8]|nr:hypothetical protein [Leptolyngbya sp. SIO1D8]